MSYVCITIDTEGDSADNPYSTFFGVEIIIPELIKLFSQYNIKATFFIQEDEILHVGSRFSILWKSLEAHNHEIGYHAHGLIGSSTEKKERIITKGIQKLRELGFDPISFRAGRYHFNNSFVRILENNGIKYDSSIVSGLRECFRDGTERCNHIGALYRPYFLSYEDHCKEGTSKILEMPINRYLKLPSNKGGKLTGKGDNEEVLFDYFYEIRNDEVIIINMHPWDGLRTLVNKFVRDEKYGIITKFSYNFTKKAVGSAFMISNAYFNLLNSLLAYISEKDEAKFTTVKEAGEGIIGSVAN